MKIAVVAHDAKKKHIRQFVLDHRDFFAQHTLVATEHTADLLIADGFNVIRENPGPHGGDVLIAARVVKGEIQLVFFFRDLLTPQAHEHDISTLMRMSDLYNVPVAINEATAECLVKSYENAW